MKYQATNRSGLTKVVDDSDLSGEFYSLDKREWSFKKLQTLSQIPLATLNILKRNFHVGPELKVCMTFNDLQGLYISMSPPLQW